MMDAKKIKIDKNTEICGWTKTRVQELVATNDKALHRSILLLDSLQTEAEKSSRMTLHWNTQGWNMCDAKRGGKWAWLLKKGYTLYPNEKAKAQKAMQKYWRQMLCEIAIRNGYTPA